LLRNFDAYMIRNTLIHIGFIMVFNAIGIQIIHAQKLKSDSAGIYKINKLIEIPVTLGLFAVHPYGFKYINDKPGLSTEEIAGLDADNIWKFDRKATEQGVSFRDEAARISDFAMNVSLVLPALLVIDKEIQKDWFDLLVLYGETHAINTSAYIMTCAMVNRNRPFLYYEDVDMDEKTGGGTQISFFSGHTSTAASSSFFVAKVLSDYHPDLGNKKFWIYGAALIPPAIVGYYRYRALKHFPTDVISGLVVGAAAGILIPEFHKRKKKNPAVSFMPFTGEVSGLKISYTIR